MLDYPGEYIAVLSAGNHEFLVKDKGRNAGDKAVFPSRFDSAHLRGIFIAGENFLGASGIKASFTCNGDKRIMVTDILAIGKMCFEQGQFKRRLFVCFSAHSTGHFSRPVKQAMRVKRVHHPHIFMIVEREIKVSARATQPVAITFALCGSSAIFLRSEERRRERVWIWVVVGWLVWWSGMTGWC